MPLKAFAGMDEISIVWIGWMLFVRVGGVVQHFVVKRFLKTDSGITLEGSFAEDPERIICRGWPAIVERLLKAVLAETDRLLPKCQDKPRISSQSKTKSYALVLFPKERLFDLYDHVKPFQRKGISEKIPKQQWIKNPSYQDTPPVDAGPFPNAWIHWHHLLDPAFLPLVGDKETRPGIALRTAAEMELCKRAQEPTVMIAERSALALIYPDAPHNEGESHPSVRLLFKDDAIVVLGNDGNVDELSDNLVQLHFSPPNDDDEEPDDDEYEQSDASDGSDDDTTEEASDDDSWEEVDDEQPADDAYEPRACSFVNDGPVQNMLHPPADRAAVGDATENTVLLHARSPVAFRRSPRDASPAEEPVVAPRRGVDVCPPERRCALFNDDAFEASDEQRMLGRDLDSPRLPCGVYSETQCYDADGSGDWVDIDHENTSDGLVSAGDQLQPGTKARRRRRITNARGGCKRKRKKKERAGTYRTPKQMIEFLQSLRPVCEQCPRGVERVAGICVGCYKTKVRLEYHKSDIPDAGNGLFVVGEPGELVFSKGSYLLVYQGKPYIPDELLQHVFGYGKTWIDATAPDSCMARYINRVNGGHAPNVRILKSFNVRAERDLYAGQELLTVYGSAFRGIPAPGT
eukprot:TRINITY_DN206_c0_g2_i2.p1 TRINITY_DN206_c0_g2~~TRINITY_DN206_c0_g2_i2.p1  ORF type:complete len:649 (-),score=39.09 TRINITY_DN206_c0_g2_i2:1302-3197(-)